MAETSSQVFFPTTLQELYSAWERFPDAVPYAGGSGIVGPQTERDLSMPDNILSLSRIEELSRYSRTERYLDLGACVTLDAVLSLGKVVPDVLRDASAAVANPGVRRLATIGGNAAAADRRMTLFSALVALDARFELRTASNARWVAASRFTGKSGGTALEAGELLTRIRIPLEAYEGALFRRLGPPGYPGSANASFCFVALAQKHSIVEVRTVMAGDDLLFDRKVDAVLSGKGLPLGQRDVVEFVEQWKERLGRAKEEAEGAKQDRSQAEAPFPSGILEDRFVNLAESAALNLAE